MLWSRVLGRVAAVGAIIALTGCGAGPVATGPAAPPGQPLPGSVVVGPLSEAGTVVPPAQGLPGCTLPALPRAGTSLSGMLGSAMGGPALTVLQGGAARGSFSLDGGDLTVAPPRAGDRPSVPAGQAECAALAALNTDNGPLLWAALQGGVAIGYGRVSVAPALLSVPPPSFYGTVGNGPKPKLPPPSPYQQRLAWVVVVKEVFVSSCPMMVASPSSAAPPPDDHGYGVFLMDARTGSDALLYVEGRGQPCGGPGRVAPSVVVPAEQVSVPWTLLSRSSDGYAGTISASVLPCDGYSDTVLVERDRPAVRVVVFRPVDAACGEPSPVTLALHAATVTSDLPAQISHEPVGLYIPLPSRPSVTPPATSGVLRTLSEADNGSTIHIRVGSVLAVPPLLGVDHQAPSPVVSSAPAVLGPLDGGSQSRVGEFRAWRAGNADLTVPTSACHSLDRSALPCSGPWVVHVQVG